MSLFMTVHQTVMYIVVDDLLSRNILANLGNRPIVIKCVITVCHVAQVKEK